MAYELKRRFFESLPVAIKRGICWVPFSWLAGTAYRTVYSRGRWMDHATHQELRNFQERELGKVLQFATDQVPAYRHLRAVTERHKPFEALKSFPLLDKDSVQANQDVYLPREFERIPHYEATTGGTSGNQLKIYLDDHSQALELGFMHRQWQRVGYTPRHRKATFRGVAFRRLQPEVFWQQNPIYNELQFSPFHMNDASLGSYVDRLIEFGPHYLHGYPSAIDVLAEYVLRNDLSRKIRPIRAALLGSEGATDAQRGRIERAFGTRAFSWYGHSERLILAAECEQDHSYHHTPDYGIVEIIDDLGNSCDTPGQRGELVGTGLINRCMPLIRYRTGDYATRCESRCDCGRNWERFSNVEGRWKQDMIIGKSGTKISVTALNMHGALFDRVRRYQYVQDRPGACVLHVMVAPDFSEFDSTEILRAYNAKTGNEVDWSVQPVDDIPLTDQGKLRWLRSSIAIEQANRSLEQSATGDSAKSLRDDAAAG